MSVGRLMLLAVALLAGGGAFFLMLTSQSPAPVQVVNEQKSETIRVLVADEGVERGALLTPDKLKWATWPKELSADGYITDAEEGAREELSTAVARTTIAPNEPIIEAKVVRKGAAGYLAALLTPGMRAVTMEVRAETASGGFILPGDRVDVMRTTDEGTVSIVENVRVLAVDQVQSENLEEPSLLGRTVTMEMAPTDAQLFLTARQTAALSLTLRSLFEPETPLESSRRSAPVQVIRFGRS